MPISSRHPLRCALLLSILALEACASNSDGALDSGHTFSDAGVVGEDASAARDGATALPDANRALRDAGSVANDGGASDAGVAAVDAGSVAIDAGSVAVDSGPVSVDAGPVAAPDAGPSWIIGGVATCGEAESLRGGVADSAATLQMCIDRTPLGMVLELSPGRYGLGSQLRLDRSIGLRTQGRAGSAACAVGPGHGCVELLILPSFTAQFGAFRATAPVQIDHLVVNGNRQGRAGSASAQQCASLEDNTRGFNATLDCSRCSFNQGASINALCGTGLLVIGPASEVEVSANTFAFNGVHNVSNMWADGLTVLDAVDAAFNNNAFVDNTDIDLIFGGCPRCEITGNTVTHSADPAGGAFAAIMIQKWPGTSGNYGGVDISGNRVDCGAARLCGSGLYIGSESWYPETPYGTLTEGTTSGLITGNTIVNTMNALYVAARGLAIYGNNFATTHGMQIPNTCGRPLVSVTPIVISPTTRSCHFNGENVPGHDMYVHYSGADWTGCIPNWPF